MRELNVVEVKEVSGGVAFLGWVAYGAAQAGMAAGRAIIANPRGAVIGLGLVLGWISEGE